MQGQMIIWGMTSTGRVPFSNFSIVCRGVEISASQIPDNNLLSLQYASSGLARAVWDLPALGFPINRIADRPVSIAPLEVTGITVCSKSLWTIAHCSFLNRYDIT